MPRLVTKAMHAYIDYPVALGLMVIPYLLGLGSANSMALWLSVVTGIAALIMTGLTDHEAGVVRILPYKFHLAIDATVGALFVAVPSIFGFSGLEAVYYWVIGATVLVVVAFHKPDDDVLRAS